MTGPGHGLADTRLRVLTWNLWWRFGDDWEARQPAIAETLRRADPDLACLQEVWQERDGPCQAEGFAEGLGYHHAYAPAAEATRPGDVSLGNAVLSRWPISETEIRRLPSVEGHEELRVALRAEVDGPRGPFGVYVTHLNYRFAESHIRQMQVRALCELIAEAGDRAYPPILSGDLNAEPHADEIRMLTGRAAVPVPRLSFFDAWEVAGDGPGHTEIPANPLSDRYVLFPRRIDYVLVGAGVGEPGAGFPVAAWLEGVEPVDGVQPSDHYAVVAELRY